MNKKDWNEGLNHLDPDLIEQYVLQKEELVKKKKVRSVWLRTGALAACLALIVGTILVFRPENSLPSIDPYFPDGEPWAPIIQSTVDEEVLRAEKVGGIFESVKIDGGTNQYTKIYTRSLEYLNLIPLPNAEYLPIYSAKNRAANRQAFQSFINKYLSAATSFFGVDSSSYTIEADRFWTGETSYTAEVSKDRTGIRFVAKNNVLYFYNYNLKEKRMTIHGDMVSVLESDTNEQLKEKLKDTIVSVCEAFGKSYTDVKIVRSYFNYRLQSITVYLYTPEETIFPSNFTTAPMTSDYISLSFYPDWGNGTSYHWGGSQDEAFLCNVNLYETMENWNTYYTVASKGKMITLQEAQRLLEEGYVFGGHFCPLCMAAQPEIDFSTYTSVSIRYVSNFKGEIWVPFYVFYKYLGQTPEGIGMYARTYVPAVQVSGMEEYFQSQKANHS
ncbi:MAG: hypothetical protein IJX08_08540 [Clostridia bacterium]|nr:hypothetical protein [Clostridia bacterium]